MPSNPHPNVIVILSDQLRADCVGCYGNPIIRTPPINLCPTLMDCAGLEVAPEVQGRNLQAALTGEKSPHRDYIFAENGAVKMLRGSRYKLVYYPTQPYGELYDLAADPDECYNIYDDPEHQQTRDQMMRDLLDRIIHTEGPRHGASNRETAYWRYLYSRPFEENNE
ncbi:MAG TPA: DUF4976 domain-containing protein [candidate division Zixibacteria bacterium]|nr:DUF4976 domain-containing protein [candidate division Zixibacteria bacterium]